MQLSIYILNIWGFALVFKPYANLQQSMSTSSVSSSSPSGAGQDLVAGHWLLIDPTGIISKSIILYITYQ